MTDFISNIPEDLAGAIAWLDDHINLLYGHIEEMQEKIDKMEERLKYVYAQDELVYDWAEKSIQKFGKPDEADKTQVQC